VSGLVTLRMREKGANRRIARFRVLPLDQLRGLPVPVGTECVGVYFLWRGPKLLYIGHSLNVSLRVGQHAYFGKKFTRSTYEPCHCHQTRSAEAHYVLRYEPPLNLTRTG
jgi:hypothetical protein